MSPEDFIVSRARPDDIAGVIDLLKQSKLPLDDIERHAATMVVAKDTGRVVGSAALEVYADGALLRSVAVASELQGHGLGRRLTNAALELAQELRMPALFLLTTTAENYFPAFGFERIDRSAVPSSVQASVEFTSACPSSAVVMRKTL